MLRFFALLTGDRHTVLAQHGPVSRRKVIAIGSGLLLVTGLWLFNGFNIGSNALGLDPLRAAGLGLGMAMVVFMVDRMMLLSTGVHWAVGCTRVALALLLAIIGGIGLDLYFMRSEIEQTLLQVHQEDRIRMMEVLEMRYVPERAGAQGSIADARMALAAAEADWRQEMDGSAGTGRYGEGAVARAKERIVEDRKRDLAEAQEHERMVTRQFTAEKQARAAELDRAQRGGGFFERIHAMHRYMMSDRLVLASYLGISVVLVIIELLPLLLKAFIPRTAYERGVELADHLQQERMNAIAIARGRSSERLASMPAEEHRAQARLVAITHAYNSAIADKLVPAHCQCPPTRTP